MNQQTFIKTYTYREHTFQVIIELFAHSERCINGKSFHKMTISQVSLPLSYMPFILIDSSTDLKKRIIETVAPLFDEIDKLLNKSPEQTTLEEMGFEKVST